MDRKTATKIVASCLSVIVLCAVIVGYYYLFQGSYDYAFQIFSNEAYEPDNTMAVEITIKEGDSTKAVAQNLAAKGVVKDSKTTMIKIYCSRFNGQIKPGKYLVSPSMKIEEVLSILAQKNEKEES